jgi:hypothetical protein
MIFTQKYVIGKNYMIPVLALRENFAESKKKERNKSYFQCCGSGSGIRCLFYPWVRDPGLGKNRDPDPG